MEHNINTAICAKEVRVINYDGNNLGILFLNDAINKALEEGYDLVQVSDGEIPVCKIMEFSKLKYKEQKALKHQRKAPDIKEFRFTSVIQDHDIEVKVKQMQTLLDKDHPIRLVVVFRGREIKFKDKGLEVLTKIKSLLTNAKFESLQEEEKTYTQMVRKLT
jgi:translation initiation factor IF-3